MARGPTARIQHHPPLLFKSHILFNRFNVAVGLVKGNGGPNALPRRAFEKLVLKDLFDSSLLFFSVGHTVCVEEFDSIVFRWVMGGSNHYSRVCFKLSGEKGE